MGIAKPTLRAIIAIILALVLGVAGGMIWARWPVMQWENHMDWVAILGLLGAVINAVVIWVVSVSIAHKLEERTIGRRFEKELVGSFGRKALDAAEKIHDLFNMCTDRCSFTDGDRRHMVRLFSALAQEIQLIEHTVEMCEITGSTLDAVKLCRGEYKDIVTDHDTTMPFSAEDIKAEGAIYANMRKSLLNVMVGTNRAE